MPPRIVLVGRDPDLQVHRASVHRPGTAAGQAIQVANYANAFKGALTVASGLAAKRFWSGNSTAAAPAKRARVTSGPSPSGAVSGFSLASDQHYRGSRTYGSRLYRGNSCRNGSCSTPSGQDFSRAAGPPYLR